MCRKFSVNATARAHNTRNAHIFFCIVDLGLISTALVPVLHGTWDAYVQPEYASAQGRCLGAYFPLLGVLRVGVAEAPRHDLNRGNKGVQ